MKKLQFLFLFLVIVCNDSFGQQVPQFSQYMFNPLFINPAYTGYKEQLYLQSYYRKQWNGVEGSPETFALGVEGFLPSSKLGIGLAAVSDKLGAQKTDALYLNVANHLRLTATSYLSFGFGFGFINSVLDGTQLTTGDPNDPTIPAGKNQTFYPDIKLGLFYYNEKFFFGVSSDNMIAPTFNFEDGNLSASPNIHIYYSGGVWIDLLSNVALRPTFLFMDDFKSPARLDINTSLVFYERVWVGASYRTSVDYASRLEKLGRSTAVVGLIELYVTEGLRIGYAYDHNISGFNVRNFTTHDISIGYLFSPRRVRLVSPRHF